MRDDPEYRREWERTQREEGEVGNSEDLLLIDEVAVITRRSVDTLRWLRHKGDGPPAHRAGRRLYYRRGKVMQWLAEQERIKAGPCGTCQGIPPEGFTCNTCGRCA